MNNINYSKLYKMVFGPMVLGLTVLAVIAVVFTSIGAFITLTPNWMFWPVVICGIAWALGYLLRTNL